MMSEIARDKQKSQVLGYLQLHVAVSTSPRHALGAWTGTRGPSFLASQAVYCKVTSLPHNKSRDLQLLTRAFPKLYNRGLGQVKEAGGVRAG